MWPFRKKCTLEDYVRIKNQVAIEIAQENELFDKYLELPNRPKIKTMLRETEVSEPFEAEIADLNDYYKWRKDYLNAQQGSESSQER